MFLAKFLTVSAVFASLVGVVFSAPRLVGGQDSDSSRQFPHHVHIIPSQTDQRCGGTILNAWWVVTSASCVKNFIRLDLHFGKKTQNNTRTDFFSVSVNKDHVFPYPTNYDDIALIKIPVRLVFSETIAPVNISKLPALTLDKKFSVMPGFNEVVDGFTPPNARADESLESGYFVGGDDYAKHHFEEDYQSHHHHPPPHPETNKLKYGMFSIEDHHACKRALGATQFNENTQLCVKGWGTNPNAPCCSDVGSGLIVGWPIKPELIGLFSMYSPTCSSKLPSIFTYVPKYLQWIDNMIRD